MNSVMARGGKREGSGRPEGAKNKVYKQKKVFATFSISCSPEQKEQLLKIAESKGMTLSKLVVTTLLGDNSTAS